MRKMRQGVEKAGKNNETSSVEISIEHGKEKSKLEISTRV